MSKLTHVIKAGHALSQYQAGRTRNVFVQRKKPVRQLRHKPHMALHGTYCSTTGQFLFGSMQLSIGEYSTRNFQRLFESANSRIVECCLPISSAAIDSSVASSLRKAAENWDMTGAIFEISETVLVLQASQYRLNHIRQQVYQNTVFVSPVGLGTGWDKSAAAGFSSALFQLLGSLEY